jgi:hypothetical protein
LAEVRPVEGASNRLGWPLNIITPPQRDLTKSHRDDCLFVVCLLGANRIGDGLGLRGYPQNRLPLMAHYLRSNFVEKSIDMYPSLGVHKVRKSIRASVVTTARIARTSGKTNIEF